MNAYDKENMKKAKKKLVITNSDFVNACKARRDNIGRN